VRTCVCVCGRVCVRVLHVLYEHMCSYIEHNDKHTQIRACVCIYIYTYFIALSEIESTWDEVEFSCGIGNFVVDAHRQEIRSTVVLFGVTDLNATGQEVRNYAMDFCLRECVCVYVYRCICVRVRMRGCVFIYNIFK